MVWGLGPCSVGVFAQKQSVYIMVSSLLDQVMTNKKYQSYMNQLNTILELQTKLYLHDKYPYLVTSDNLKLWPDLFHTY